MSQDAHTFLFADLAGFTALTEAHGDEFAADSVEAFCASVETRLGAHDAEHVKTIGDAVLVRVPRESGAVELALSIVHDLAGRHGVPLVRAGMHTGAAVRRGDDWFGATVNLASRVAALARAGEVLLTDATAAGSRRIDGVVLDDRGVHRFRHVASPTRIHLARRRGAALRTLPVDPVCHMAVEPERARRVATDQDAVYVCSLACEERFRADPAAFDSVAAGGEDGGASGPRPAPTA